jgi:hypothetical protein
MRFSSSALALALAVASFPALAQDLSYGSVGADFSRVDGTFGETDYWSLDGAAEVTYGKVVVGATAEVAEGSTSARQAMLELFAGYRVTPELIVGLSVGQSGKVVSMTDFAGLWLGYETATFAFGADVVRTEDDFTTYRLASEVAISPAVTLSGYARKYDSSSYTAYNLQGTWAADTYSVSVLTSQNTGDDNELIALSGSYAITDRFTLRGGIGEWQASAGADDRAMFINAGYSFTEGGTAELYYLTHDDGTFSRDKLGLAVSFDLGKSARTSTRIAGDLDDMIWDFD